MTWWTDPRATLGAAAVAALASFAGIGVTVLDNSASRSSEDAHYRTDVRRLAYAEVVTSAVCLEDSEKAIVDFVSEYNPVSPDQWSDAEMSRIANGYKSCYSRFKTIAANVTIVSNRQDVLDSMDSLVEYHSKLFDLIDEIGNAYNDKKIPDVQVKIGEARFMVNNPEKPKLETFVAVAKKHVNFDVD
ncbi:hypothetical protein VST63_19495 [Mycolicibacterium sp. 050232]|uniref:hypothetical protein n=1 Tax=Mycolicibacterium sp. 050232 TaxID=3113982 RepID=UPI002E2C1C06|nr:hypothetical protein [Mycolicibacterium sp. 050232]MED5814548.1 hypothetical protein [Mycolicibacterium sp. 050232]